MFEVRYLDEHDLEGQGVDEHVGSQNICFCSSGHRKLSECMLKSGRK